MTDSEFAALYDEYMTRAPKRDRVSPFLLAVVIACGLVVLSVLVPMAIDPLKGAAAPVKHWTLVDGGDGDVCYDDNGTLSCGSARGLPTSSAITWEKSVGETTVLMKQPGEYTVYLAPGEMMCLERTAETICVNSEGDQWRVAK